MGSTNQVSFLHTRCPVMLVSLKRRRSPSPPASLNHGGGSTDLVASTTLSCKEENVYSPLVALFFLFPLDLFFFAVDVITR
jgi:hypothetical protein